MEPAESGGLEVVSTLLSRLVWLISPSGEAKDDSEVVGPGTSEDCPMDELDENLRDNSEDWFSAVEEPTAVEEGRSPKVPTDRLADVGLTELSTNESEPTGPVGFIIVARGD